MQQRRCKVVIATVRALLLASMFIFQGTTQAATMIDATNPAAIVDMLEWYGDATLKADEEGDPLIEGEIDGISYDVYFYSCKDGKNCQRIQFRASWDDSGKNSFKYINDWNRKKVFGKAYKRIDGDVVVEMPVLLNHGVSEENLDNVIGLWSTVMKEFRDYLK